MLRGANKFIIIIIVYRLVDSNAKGVNAWKEQYEKYIGMLEWMKSWFSRRNSVNGSTSK